MSCISICFQSTKINARSWVHNHFTYHPIGKMDRKLHVTSVNKSSGDHSIMFLQKVKEPSESVREESCQKQKGYGFQLTLCNSLILYHGRQTDNKNTLATGWPAVSIYLHHIKRGKGLREFGRRWWCWNHKYLNKKTVMYSALPHRVRFRSKTAEISK